MIEENNKKSNGFRDKIQQKMGKKNVKKEEVEKVGLYKIFLCEMIGEGSYGKVFKAEKQNSDEKLACKIISKSKLQNLQMLNPDQARELQKRFKTESKFHKKLLGCSNIVKLYETIETEKGFYLMMEYCETDLAKVLKKQGILSEVIALRYFSDMLRGYKSIYQKNAFHRDLKPENLLLKDDTIKISDFGFVKIFTQIDKVCKSGKDKLRTESKVGSIRYMAPDVLALTIIGEKTYNAQKSDVWSMGIILYKMLYGREPFNGKNQAQMIKNIKEKELIFPDTVQLSPEVIRPAKVAPEIIQIIRQMIHTCEDTRISFLKLYDFINAYMKEKQLTSKIHEKVHSNINVNIDEVIDENTEATTEKAGGSKESQAKNKQEQLITIYNKLIVKIYHDAITYATLLEIGIENYYQFSCKLMTLIHEKRSNYIQQSKNDDVNQKLKQEIPNYHNTFYVNLKEIANLQKDETLESLLYIVYDKMVLYQDYDLLMKEVESYLLHLLLMLALEIHLVKYDYVYTLSIRADHDKQKVIMHYKNNIMTIIKRKIQPNQITTQEIKDQKVEKHHREKSHREKSQRKDKDKSVDSKEHKERKKKQRASRDKKHQE